MTFKDLSEKVERLQKLLTQREMTTENYLEIYDELAELRVYLSNPEYIEDVEELKRELIQTC